MAKSNQAAPVFTYIAVVIISHSAMAAPFYLTKTVGESLKSADVVAVTKLRQTATKDVAARFELIEVLKGKPHVADAANVHIADYYSAAIGGRHLLLGKLANGNVRWQPPMPISAAAHRYLSKRFSLPAKTQNRLLFFLVHLEHEEAIIAEDASEQLSQFSFAEMTRARAHFNCGNLLEWTTKPEVSTSSKCLYYKMVGIAGGGPEYLYLAEKLRSKEKRNVATSAAVMAAFLNLGGVTAANELQTRFIKNPNADFSDTYSAFQAFHFDSRHSRSLPREARLAAFRTIIERPNLADLAIRDFIYEKDWSMVDRLAALFASSRSKYARVPIIAYMQACPLPEAKSTLKRLQAIDPKSYKRYQDFYGAIAK